MPAQSYLATMRRENLRTFFESSPTVRLLRSDHAPIVLDFLSSVFKSGSVISVGQLDLRTQLASYQEELHGLEPSLLTGQPEQYLTKWTDSGWLQRFLEATSVEPQFQLTQYAEEALRFVESALSKGNTLVGTESRLRLVIETLEDIVRGASADPERRLDYLRAQRTQIDEEMQAIAAGKSVQVYRPNQIRERFQTAVELLKALQADFRAVEERFQLIARDVQQQQAAGQQTRGGILGSALDAEDVLKQQDEGVSFFAFAAFLFSPTQQAALRKTIEEVQELVALAGQDESLTRVRRMVPALLAEADKVMKTTARLSSTLRRLLDAQAAEHRRRLANVLRDVKQAALELRGRAPDACRLEIASELSITSPLARTFWKPSTAFDASEPTEHVIDLTKVQQIAGAFAKLQRLDFRKLRHTIREATYQGKSATLAEVVGDRPMPGGVVQILGYMQIAHDDGHEIHREHSETLRIIESDRSNAVVTLRVPRIVFHPKAKTAGRRPK